MREFRSSPPNPSSLPNSGDKSPEYHQIVEFFGQTKDESDHPVRKEYLEGEDTRWAGYSGDHLADSLAGFWEQYDVVDLREFEYHKSDKEGSVVRMNVFYHDTDSDSENNSLKLEVDTGISWSEEEIDEFFESRD